MWTQRTHRAVPAECLLRSDDGILRMGHRLIASGRTHLEPDHGSINTGLIRGLIIAS